MCKKSSSDQQLLKSLVETLRRGKDLTALEGEHSALQSELQVKRQTLEDSQLQSDLLEQEKDNVTPTLERVWTPYS
ncbi:hypothetical protein TURU_077957 [Turdus rufiventris]|nr:hypothetical protein TURU_077957 [Turdus rufiventris]